MTSQINHELLPQEPLPYLPHRRQETWAPDLLRKEQEGLHLAALTLHGEHQVGQVGRAGLRHVVEARHSLTE